MVRRLTRTSSTSKRAPWHPEDIKAALRKRTGITIRALARRHGYTGEAFYMTLRQRHWPAVERIIAKTLGVPVQEIWPDRYLRNGEPRAMVRSRLEGGARAPRSNGARRA